jgi:hypothetical protein
VETKLDAPGDSVLVIVVVISGAGMPFIIVLMPEPGAPVFVDT